MATPGAPTESGYTALDAGDLTIYVKYDWTSGSCEAPGGGGGTVPPRLIRVAPARGGGWQADFSLAAEG